MIWLWIVLFFGVCSGLLATYVYFVEIRLTGDAGDHEGLEPVEPVEPVGTRR